MIANKSFTAGNFPCQLKCAHVKPLLKKHNLDHEDLSNYRPVSNLAFLSKLLENLVAARLKKHLNDSGINNNFQSAYTEHRSTETALLRIHNDLCKAVDTSGAAALIMLDLSAAFDTLDHSILLDCFQYLFGLQDTVLSWLSSYLSDRRQHIIICDANSSEQHLPYGVPQGSVLGPLFFNMYTFSLSSVFMRHGLSYHMYADDTQLYISFNPKSVHDAESAFNSLKACFSDVQTWMKQNWLKLNPDKTEFILVITRLQINKALGSSSNFPSSLFKPSNAVKNLGVHFDSSLTMAKQVEAIGRSVNYQLRQLWRIRQYLNLHSTKTLAHALISSRLDYGNCLLYGITGNLMQRLQRLQNSAARLVTKSPKSCHITPILHKLHWLPVHLRIEYKILMYVYKALNGLAPKYIADLLTSYTPGRHLRSSNVGLLHIPKTHLGSFGDKAFSTSAPILWNSLPVKIKSAKSLASFKSSLKTYLFNAYFNT